VRRYKRELEELSAQVRQLIDGRAVDLRDHGEGPLSKLRSDIHALAARRGAEVDALQRERDLLKNTLADISHQIKTPLTSIGIMADLLENAPPEKQAEFAANIRRSLDRADWLVSALLKMAKLEAGAVALKRERVPSRALVAAALESLRIPLEVKNQRVTLLEEADLRCDLRWTAEALANVIKNASEHSPQGGEILIGAGANPICAWVSVTGGGHIPRADIPNLFKRFHASRRGTGYGIGLPLALAILRGQQGDIEVEGGSGGQGATFTLKFYKTESDRK
jgi:signal transduction histidine kinase